ncbi:MAG: carbon storage regulator [Planctomycetaceae bacterium]|nr:carbon storage regulator [Planctomycetaceae bacterium]
MLVLSRKIGEEVLIANNVRIRVVDVRGSRIKVQIDAPREVAIRRSEVPALGEGRPVHGS